MADAYRIAREQQTRIATAAEVGLKAVKPLLELQTSMLRLMANNFELMVRNYEKGIETFTTAIEQQHDRAQQAAE